VADSAQRGAKKKETGSTLVLRDLRSGEEVRIQDVTAYAFDEAGRWLAYTVSSKDGARDGAFARALDNGRTHDLATGAGNYKQLTMAKDGSQLAFVSDRGEYGREKARYALYHVSLAGSRPTAREVVDAGRVGGGRLMAEKGRLAFAEDGRALQFGIAPPPLDSIPADSLADKAVFDLWHWQDPACSRSRRWRRRPADDVFVFTRSTVAEAPDVWAAGPDLTRPVRLSEANPQQSGCILQAGELRPVQEVPDGLVLLRASLGRPAQLRTAHGRNVINPTHYVSNGYLVFEPDIHYEIGYPGPSAVKSIVPGVQKLLERGYVDPKGLGLQGQSWGGYQTLFIITQSQMFSAAMAGAPVVNMTQRLRRHSLGHGRGARVPVREDAEPHRQVDLGRAEPVHGELAAVLAAARDDAAVHHEQRRDDAVPWYQGIETFVAMRRLTARRCTSSTTTTTSTTRRAARTRRTSRCACSSSSTTS
jgi:dipeptidyl aminopeptidase/acylaminoacyl peptidase